jgi:hypothetical protein
MNINYTRLVIIFLLTLLPIQVFGQTRIRGSEIRELGCPNTVECLLFVPRPIFLTR